MNCRVPAKGILTELPLARLRPAVGEMSRQAQRKPRGLEKCAGCPEPRTHNTRDAQVRQQVVGLRRSLFFAGRASSVRELF